MFDMIKLGKNISSRRKAVGMTQMELADRLGISYQAVSNWERGQTAPDISKLGELAETLDCSVDELLDSKRTAEVIKQVEDKVPDPDITPQELADVAPILKPEQVDRTLSSILSGLGDSISNVVGKAMESADIQNRVSKVQEKVQRKLEEAGRRLDNFDPSRVRIVHHDTPDVDEEPEGQDEEDSSAERTNFETLLQLAPFLSEDTLSEIFLDLADKEEPELEMLGGLAPFIDSDILGKVALKIFERSGTLEDVVPIAAFLDSDALGEISKLAMARGGTLADIAPIAAFLDEDALGEIVKIALANGDDASKHPRGHGPGFPWGKPWSRRDEDK